MKKLALLLVPLMLLAACGEENEATTPSAETPVPSTMSTTQTGGNANTQSADIDDAKKDDDSAKSKETVKIDTTKTTTKDLAPLVVTIDSGNFFFKPATITAKVGQPITVNLTNSGFHDFKIDALNVDVDLHNVPSGTVTFTPTKAGTFEYYCSVGSHKAMGMKGTLTVTE